MKKVLVTGGLGFVGSNLVDRLKKTSPEIEITVIDNLSSESSSKDYRRDDVEYIIDDIRNLDKSKYANLKFDVIFHLAALARIQPSFKDPSTYFDIDARGTQIVCEYARQIDSKVVYSGSSSFYAGPMLNPYAFAKHVGEDCLELYSKVYGLKCATARFFNVNGDRQPISGPYATVIGIFENLWSEGKKLTVTGDGKQRRDFTHITDIVDGLIEIGKGEYDAEIFNLGTGVNFSINEIANLFEDSKIEYVPKRPGEAEITLADISKTLNMTEWSPKVEIDQYIVNYCATPTTTVFR